MSIFAHGLNLRQPCVIKFPPPLSIYLEYHFQNGRKESKKESAFPLRGRCGTEQCLVKTCLLQGVCGLDAP